MHHHFDKKADSLDKTPLHSLHQELGAKMIDFAGYHMPLNYRAGILNEHRHTRNYAGLFDISHMGQIRLTGMQAGQALESLTPSRISGLANNCLRYTVLTNDQGGILDDLIIAKVDNDWLLVVNAACKQQDFAYISQYVSAQSQPVLMEDRALLALQGPMAASILSPLITAGSIDIPFMTITEVHINGIDCLVSRCGYTGEDGFEISVADKYSESIARLLLARDNVLPIGLGARDSLRLEAGLCLYGHDINIETNPVEAGLGWLIDSAYLSSESTRNAQFPGAETILNGLRSGTDRKRVGLFPTGRIPVRAGSSIKNCNGETVGHITSGGFGATVDGPIAMGYVKTQYSDVGQKLSVDVRDSRIEMKVTGLPFVPHHYHR